MKTVTRATTSLLFALAILMVACGGGRSDSDSEGDGSAPPPKKQSSSVSHSSIPGMHIHDVRKQTASTIGVFWDGLFPKVYAESVVTIQVSQNWEGICSASPAPGTGQAFISYILFGIGQNSKSSCPDSFNDTDGSVAADNAQDGKLVFGAGTLSNLVVSTDRGTNIISSGGVPVKIWVKRNGTAQFTGLTCTLPSGAGELVCQGTETFALQNLDRIIATATKGDADNLVNLAVNFTKSVP